jgi:RNA polymerase sigma factor (sigma-70 family)
VTPPGLRDDSSCMDELAQRFARWRDHADVPALAAAFDVAAPRLLSLALHLAGNPADAEDLLQSTFVQAMQKAASFDARQPLLPWLCGILAGEAKNLRRREDRRRSEPLPDLAGDGTGPLAASERSELVAALRQHVEQLPGEQRQVLLLQLQHGLTPAEIAEALGAAPGTVRMRLHRGLAALRRLLPAGLASLLLWAWPERGLAAVRAAVLRQAKLLLPAGSALAVKQLAAAALLLALCAFGWWLAPPRPVRDPATASRAPLAPAIAGHAGGHAGEDTGDPTAATVATQDRVAVPAPPAAPDAVRTGSLQLRVVRGDGRPLPHATATVVRVEGDADAVDDAHCLTMDADGEALLAGLEPGAVEVQVIGGSRGRATSVAGRTTPLEVRRCAETAAAHGRVVHADGTPAAGAKLLAQYNLWFVFAVGVAGEDGRFALDGLEEYQLLGAALPGFAPSGMHRLLPGRELELVLPGKAARIEGTVVDEAGDPIAGAQVVVQCLQPPRYWLENGNEVDRAGAARGCADGAGAFAFDVGPGKTRLQVQTGDYAPEVRLVDGEAGAVTSVRVVLLRALPLRGRVVDGNGAPVAGAEVMLNGTSGIRRHTAADGSFAYRSAPTGLVALRVEGLTIEPFQGERDRSAEPLDWTIVVQRRPRWPLRFVDERGVPLVDWEVGSTALGEGPVETTDADGRVAVLTRVADRGRLELRRENAWTRVDWPPAATPDVETTIVIATPPRADAALSGRLVDAGDRPCADARVQVRWPSTCGVSGSVATAADGSFRIEGLPADEFELIVHRLGNRTDQLSFPALRCGETRDLGCVRLPAEGMLSLRLVRSDGAVVEEPNVFLFDAQNRERPAPSVDGVPHPWPAGRYRYSAMCANALWAGGTIDITAGSPTICELVLTPGVRRDLRFPVPTPAWGAPKSVKYVLRAPDGSSYYQDEFDPRAELPYCIAPPLSLGTWRVELLTDDGARFAGAFTVADLEPRAGPIKIAVEPSR